MIVYIVIKKTISGWGSQNLKVFKNKQTADQFIESQKKHLQVEFVLEEIEIILS